ncbi:hypothetical protein ICJ33_13550 [Pseudomonas simiae]|uniref:hypothetical protein n=1 Tax=Pseudomonas simiae TaxID=321846 RepID=UPI0018E3C1F9|nr:hypothetical protein [Pseudomonas simiae]QQD30014.1 hypothetical protein ICJ33_13550 [Pseudomonas simiae]
MLSERWTQQSFWGASTLTDIDLGELEQLARGDPVAIQALLNELADSNQKDWGRLLKLYAQLNLPSLADFAHRIKGGIRVINGDKGITACGWLEFACASQEHAEVTTAGQSMEY